MDLYPAIDLRAGRTVRLYQGDFSRETAYGTDPVTVARGFAAAGARWIHLVDLDAARTGAPENRPVIAAIVAGVGAAAQVQAGGGVRDQASAEALLEAGVDRVVIGTAAVENPQLVRDLAGHHQVAVGIDVRGRVAAVRGWLEGSGVDLFDLLARFEDCGVAAFVVTEIARDGTFAGPDLDGLAGVLEATAVDVIASGGVGSAADLTALATLEAGGRRLAGAIVGKALHAGLLTVEEAMAACAASG
ncbi:MAG TPA: 1-(5-phosphoribosyl)-5-[(5-phosphoribosylamino)methylideneamino]imidazole-4-carboxamide isomerase [Acidimicrobiales bacterium]|nr:1-(5-phosphoribosyl)-5-[(5-phosphoribosylamino)methylideneamino]imidazole-4-carboxamide isomerase [Acidimicrobiales bacterium]